MIGNNVWPDEARSRLLHLIPQPYEHADAEIRGSPEALLRLGYALIEAAKLPQTASHKVEMMAADGEGYAIKIYPMSDKQMDDGPIPYATLGFRP